jgi:hypothetical protein
MAAMGILTVGSGWEPRLLDSGPTAYWRMNEASGQLVDLVGGLRWSPTGTPEYRVDGPIVDDAVSTGVDLLAGDWFDTPDAAALDFGDGPLSFGVWVLIHSLTGGLQIVYAKGSQGNYFFDALGRFQVDNDVATIVRQTNALTNGWHWYVYTRFGPGTGNNRIYVDGLLSTTDGAGIGGALATNAVAPALGIYTDHVTGPVNGEIAELATWGRVLSADDIAGMYFARECPE